jgi:hypothetical protein
MQWSVIVAWGIGPGGHDDLRFMYCKSGPQFTVVPGGQGDWDIIVYYCSRDQMSPMLDSSSNVPAAVRDAQPRLPMCEYNTDME